MVLVESLARGVSVVQLVFGLSNPRQSAKFPLVKPKIRARIGQNVCPIRGEFAAGERFHQGQRLISYLEDRRTARVQLPLPQVVGRDSGQGARDAGGREEGEGEDEAHEPCREHHPRRQPPEGHVTGEKPAERSGGCWSSAGFL